LEKTFALGFTHISFNRDPEEIAEKCPHSGTNVMAISGGERAGHARSPPEIANTVKT
jgi:hypothetical protein